MFGDSIIVLGDAKHRGLRDRIVELFGDKLRCRRAPAPVLRIVE
jgi:hypothetical protein